MRKIFWLFVGNKVPAFPDNRTADLLSHGAQRGRHIRYRPWSALTASNGSASFPASALAILAGRLLNRPVVSQPGPQRAGLLIKTQIFSARRRIYPVRTGRFTVKEPVQVDRLSGTLSNPAAAMNESRFY